MATGWGWDHCLDHMDLPRLTALNKYWQRYPPLHVMVAQYFGLGDKPQAEDEDLSQLAQSFPQGPIPEGIL